MSHQTLSNSHDTQTKWQVFPDWRLTPKLIFTILLTSLSFLSVSAYVFVTQTAGEPDIIVSQAAGGRTFYVAPNGSDSNSGSQAQPWKTIQFALTFQGLSPGDTIFLREGVYTEGELAFNESNPQGADGNYLTIKNFPGETPELRHTSLRFKDQNFIHVEGLTFTNVFTVSLASGSQTRPISGLRFINNTFINNSAQPEPHTTHIRASTVGGQGATPAEYVRYTDVLIQGNKIIENNTNIPDDKADALQIGGNVDYLRIIDNHLEHTTSIGITIAGREWKNKENVQPDSDDPNPDQADYVLVKGNTVKNVNGNSIYLDAPGNYVIVENNITSGATAGIMFAGEGVTSPLSYTHGIIRNNISYNNAINSNIGGREAAHRTTGVDPESCADVIKSRHVIMAHNTIYSTRNVAFLSRFQCAEHHRYKNNILASLHTINNRNRFYNLSTDFIDPSTWHIDYNLFYSGPSVKGFGWNQNYTNLSTFVAATGFDQHSIEADPKFTNPQQFDFSLQNNSPAIDTAGPLTLTTSSGTNSTSLKVADATYFTDGFNVRSGDWIRIGSGNNAPRRQVTAVNYSSNTLTLHQPLTWNNTEPVNYDYAHGGPDYGALEKDYQAPNNQPPSSPTPSTPVPTPTSTPQPPVASPTMVPSPLATPIISTPPPPTLPPAPTGNIYEAVKTAVAPVIDGNLAEYAQAPVINISNANGNQGTYSLLWDAQALYLSAFVTDTSLTANTLLHDDSVWTDDSLEFVLDVGNERSTIRDTNDYKLILNILNTLRDEKQVFANWNGSAQTAAIAIGSVGTESDLDAGYRLEIKIPWQDLEITPNAGATFGMDLGFNDARSNSSRVQSYWNNTDGGSINQPNGWGTLRLSSQTVNQPSAPPFSKRYEAELAMHGDTIQTGVSKVASNHNNYSGSGFIDMSDYPHGRGSFITWTVAVPTSGEYTLEFGYAQQGNDTRALTVLVNQSEVAVLRPTTTGSWSAWSTMSETVHLEAGSNQISVKARLARGGPNIDYLDIK